MRRSERNEFTKLERQELKTRQKEDSEEGQQKAGRHSSIGVCISRQKVPRLCSEERTKFPTCLLPQDMLSHVSSKKQWIISTTRSVSG